MSARCYLRLPYKGDICYQPNEVNTVPFYVCAWLENDGQNQNECEKTHPIIILDPLLVHSHDLICKPVSKFPCWICNHSKEDEKK